MELSNLLSLPIMCIYAFFVSKSFDLYTEKARIEKECIDYNSKYSYSSYSSHLHDENDPCAARKDIKLNELRNNKFFYLMVVGILSIVLSYYLHSGPARIGVAGGGALIILLALIENWSSFDDNKKVFVLGGGLASLIAVSYNYYS